MFSFIFKNKKGLLTVCMSTSTYWSILVIYFFICFFYAARIGYTFRLSLSHEFEQFGSLHCVHQVKISAAAGLEPGTPRSLIEPRYQ